MDLPSAGPRHEVQARRARASEERVLAALGGLRLPVFALAFTAALTAVAAIETGALAAWAAVRLGPGWAEPARLAGRLAGGAGGALVGGVLAVLVLGQRLAARRDLRTGRVEEITVSDARATVHEVEGSHRPLFAIDVGAGALLLLQAPAHERRAAPGRAAPFPAAEFTLVRAPGSGIVLELRASAPPLPADPGSPVPPLGRLRESELVPGTLDDVAGAIAAARARRRLHRG